MRKVASVLAVCVTLAGCAADVSALMMPMEPTPESIAAQRRELTEAEKTLISDTVALKLKEANHREFKWAPLVIRSHDQVTDFCGLVSGNDLDDRYQGFSKYYAQLAFDGRGKLAKV